MKKIVHALNFQIQINLSFVLILFFRKDLLRRHFSNSPNPVEVVVFNIFDGNHF